MMMKKSNWQRAHITVVYHMTLMIMRIMTMIFIWMMTMMIIRIMIMMMRKTTWHRQRAHMTVVDHIMMMMMIKNMMTMTIMMTKTAWQRAHMTVVDHMERESGVRAAAKVIFKILKMFMHVVIKSFNMSELYLSLVDFKSEGYWWCMNSASIAFNVFDESQLGKTEG